MDETTQKRLALREVLADSSNPAIGRFARQWHPEHPPASDYERGYAQAMASAALLIAEAAGIDPAPYRTTP